ncbi:hypothetical protein IQ218_02170 [Synechocystis salina LEGE 06099]|uniref:hypothetical protein n=1 Tax=Synechocystis salina TaxID=945780 RepID=UPI001881B340|nr:hypothetical protein [Synechocystis salina]MBE9202492.1 hypothetical protein [Synechocystis salina LEGE 06099]
MLEFGCLVFLALCVLFLVLLGSGNSLYILVEFSLIVLIIVFIIWAKFYESTEEIKKIFDKANNGSRPDMQSLIDSVINQNPQFRYISKLLTKLNSDKAINFFCQKWAETRADKLTKILLKARYVASQPDNITILTALKINKIDKYINEKPHLIKIVLSSFEDQDNGIAKLARRVAINLSNQETINYLFYLCIEENNQIAYQCIEKANYQSTNTKYQTLFYFLREEWDIYDKLDFDQTILQELYHSIGTWLRKIVAEKARKRGWIEWIKVVKKAKKK